MRQKHVKLFEEHSNEEHDLLKKISDIIDNGSMSDTEKYLAIKELGISADDIARDKNIAIKLAGWGKPLDVNSLKFSAQKITSDNINKIEKDKINTDEFDNVIGLYGENEFKEFTQAARDWEKRTGSQTRWDFTVPNVGIAESAWKMYLRDNRIAMLNEEGDKLIVTIFKDGAIHRAFDNDDRVTSHIGRTDYTDEEMRKAASKYNNPNN